MARYASGGRTTAGSTTLPILSLYGGGNVVPRVREIGVFNTAATAVALKLVRLTSTGTQGAGQVEAKFDPDSAASDADCFLTHSGAPTLGDDLGYRVQLGAAIGAGVIWTFSDSGLRIPKSTSDGIGIIVATGTGQACDAYMIWDE